MKEVALGVHDFVVVVIVIGGEGGVGRWGGLGESVAVGPNNDPRVRIEVAMAIVGCRVGRVWMRRCGWCERGG